MLQQFQKQKHFKLQVNIGIISMQMMSACKLSSLEKLSSEGVSVLHAKKPKQKNVTHCGFTSCLRFSVFLLQLHAQIR